MPVYPVLAKKAIETFVRDGRIINPPAYLPTELLKSQAACFVSIHLKNGDLRGCIGTILPTKLNLAQEIIANAIAAASADPRFAPIVENELTDLAISVDVLSSPEKISETSQLNPEKYGVIIKTADGRSGLLLPDLEGVDTVEQQVSLAAQKGWIDLAKDKIELWRFTVQRYK